MNGMLHHDGSRIVVDRSQHEARSWADARRLAAVARSGRSGAPTDEERMAQRRGAAIARASALPGKAGLVAIVAPLAALAALLAG